METFQFSPEIQNCFGFCLVSFGLHTNISRDKKKVKPKQNEKLETAQRSLTPHSKQVWYNYSSLTLLLFIGNEVLTSFYLYSDSIKMMPNLHVKI